MSAYEQYFNESPKENIAEFQRIIKIVEKLVPEAEQAMTYGIPGFKVNGHFFVGFGNNKNGVSFYPSSEPIAKLANKLKDYKTSKGAIQYTLENPMPQELVTEIILMRRKAELNR